MSVVQGTIEPGFEAVGDLLERQFEQGMHIGAGVCVYHRGRAVVDVWAGVADEETGRPWERDTMAICFSVTKGLTATCVHMLADRGLIDYEAPVAKYWPEFAQNGKEKITVAQVLTHQAGLAPLPDDTTAESMLDWDAMIRGIERMAPTWEPGTESGYHALTFGWLAGELVRRADGRTVGQFLREEVTTPLGISDEMHIGTRADDERRMAKLHSRYPDAAELPEEMREMREKFFGPETLAGRAMGVTMPNWTDTLDSPAGHQAEIPAVNGAMTARALARLYACLGNYGELDGVRLMSEATVRRMTERRTYRPDKVVMVPIGWSLGYMTGGSEGWPQGPRVTAFGHAGAGGSHGQADPEIGLAFGFVTNALTADLVGAGRTAALADAARTCAEALGS